MAVSPALPALGGAEPSRLGLVALRPLDIPDDVPAHLTTALAQDRDGFLWLGTQGGLVRYDGYRFRVFKPAADDPRSLPGSYVRTLLAARDGTVWAGTFSSGLAAYDPATEAFVRYQHDPDDPASLAHNRVEGLAEDGRGRLWVATSGGLDRLDPESGRFVHFRHDPADPASLADERVRGLLVDRRGRLWVGSRDGLQRWDEARGGFERVASDPADPASLAGQLVARLFEDRAGRIWIGTVANGAAVYDPATGRLARLLPRPAAPEGLSHFWVYAVAQATPGEVWLGTFGGGIDVVDAESLAVVDRLRHDPSLPGSLADDRVGALLTDRSGVVWVGTWGQGAARHDPRTRAFQALRQSPRLPEGLSHPAAVRALEVRDGTVWIGTNGNGVDLFDWERGVIGGHRPDPADPGALADGSITCLAQGEDGAVWVGTLSGVLHRLRPGARRFERFTAAQGLPGGAIRALTFGPRGELWIGAAEGLARFDPRSLAVTAYRHRPDDPASLSGHAVEAIAFGRDGTLWVGTDSGLNAFDPERGTAVRVLREAGRDDSLPNDWVPDLLVDSGGRLWVGTQGGAALLTGWDGKTARFAAVAPRLGKPAAPVEALIEDSRGWIWLGPSLRFDPQSWRSQELGPADGRAFRNYFIASRSRTARGALLFGSPEGLLIVYPERIAAWTDDPPVVVTGLHVDGVPRPGAARLRELSLAPGQRGFRLDFAALDYTAPERNRYRYRLEGYDRGWIATEAAHRSVTYTNLAPGSYRLRVQGSGRSGRLSAHEISLPVEVLPAFYQTVWFRALLLCAVVALAYGGFQLRVRRLRARGRQLERIVDERTRELRAAYQQIEEASLTDPLTGLRNRRYLEREIGADVEQSLRRRDEPDGDLVFLLLDLDHFKSVNDTWGHAAGDAVLVQTAVVLRRELRAADHLVRWGGEEFLVVARFVDRRDAPGIAEKVRAAVAAHGFRLPDGNVLERTCSVGVATYPFSPTEPQAVAWEAVVDAADRCLYAAKHSGRNRWVAVEAVAGGDPAVALDRFKAAPPEAQASGLVTVAAGRGRAAELCWD